MFDQRAISSGAKQFLLRLVLGVLFSLTGLAMSTFGQQATIVGTVTDPSGAVIPNVEVAIANRDTQVSYATQSWPQTDAAPVYTSSQEAHSRSLARTTLPFQLCRDYLVVVEGSIGPLEQLTFIIDTGTYPSIVDQRIASALGLSEREGNVALVNQSVQTKLATLPFVRLGPARVESVPVLVQDLSSLEKTLGRRIDAIAGLDVLGKNSFNINYRTKQLRFGPVERSRSAVSFETGPPLITVEAWLHDRPVRLLVDTGAATTLLFQSRLEDPISPLAGKATRGTNVSGGNFQLQPVLISDMRIGKEELGPQAGFVVADQRDEGQNFDGLLSTRGLHVEEIGFDFENRRISLKK